LQRGVLSARSGPLTPLIAKVVFRRGSLILWRHLPNLLSQQCVTDGALWAPSQIRFARRFCTNWVRLRSQSVKLPNVCGLVDARGDGAHRLEALSRK
jgi:hypothetical protein